MKKTLLSMLAILFIGCQKEGLNSLADMNTVKMSDYEILSDFTKSKDTLKILIVGNSITTHEKLARIGWLHKGGMAASSEQKDYVHLLFQQFKKDTDKNIILRYANFSNLERYPDKFNLTDFKINNFYTFRPNLTIFQLGDNTSLETQKAYKEKSIQFLKNLNSAKFLVFRLSSLLNLIIKLLRKYLWKEIINL